MIDWINLFSNALWILGLALALAAFSYASWQAAINREKISRQLIRSPLQIALNLAGVLFCAGLAATADKIYEIVLWGILAIAFGVQVVITIRSLLISRIPPA